jgi:hypothetical protein
MVVVGMKDSSSLAAVKASNSWTLWGGAWALRG